MEQRDFEVRNKQIEEHLRKMGNDLKSGMPKGWGFTLLIFDYENELPDGGMFYISTASRGDMIKAMQEFIQKQGLNSGK